MESLLLTFASCLISIFLVTEFFIKKRINTEETKIYSKLLVVNLLFSFFAIFVYLYAKNIGSVIGINVTQKIYLFLIIILAHLILLYNVAIAVQSIEFKKKINKQLNLLLIVSGVLIFTTKIDVINEGLILDASGLSYDLFMISLIVYVLIIIITTIYIFKKNKNNIKKDIPFIVLIILYIVGLIIRRYFPYIVFETFFFTYSLFIMYFTIENPDLKLLEEVHNSKEVSDNANEEKTLFLYNMTQEIRSTMKDIDDNADMILESSNLDDDKEYAREIKIIASKFNTVTNEMFDVSKLDAAFIKIYNNKYKIKNILKEIVTVYNNKCKDKNLDFRVNIDHDVPEILYGDSIGLKEILTVIMDNSVKYTKEGYIEFDVNTIVKNDICRLIFTIEDSGIGIKSEDINKIKLNDKSFSKANKLITLMNGTMMISSNYGLGTKVKIILDQKIEFNENADVVKYEEVYDNIKLLMVDDSDSGIKIIDKLIKGSNIKMDFAVNGKECIDKIKAYGKYDLILLDEQLSQISAMELIRKMKGIRNFNIPVILLSKDNTYEYNDEYKKLGFSDYLLKPVKKDDLLNKINKCVKKDK